MVLLSTSYSSEELLDDGLEELLDDELENELEDELDEPDDELELAPFTKLGSEEGRTADLTVLTVSVTVLPDELDELEEVVLTTLRSNFRDGHLVHVLMMILNSKHLSSLLSLTVITPDLDPEVSSDPSYLVKVFPSTLYSISTESVDSPF